MVMEMGVQYMLRSFNQVSLQAYIIVGSSKLSRWFALFGCFAIAKEHVKLVYIYQHDCAKYIINPCNRFWVFVQFVLTY